MQLNIKHSIFLSSILLSLNLQAQDYVSIQYMSYDEDSGATTINVPAIEINKDFGADYTLNASFVYDTISGASPTYYDSHRTGASVKIEDSVSLKQDIKYDNVKYEEERQAYGLMFTTRFESRDELTLGLNYSKEDDYESRELSLEYLFYTDKTKNSSFTMGASVQKNDVSIHCYLGNKECDGNSGASDNAIKKDLDVISAEIGYTQTIDKTSIVKGSIFTIVEDGYLSNPYMRIVRDYDTNPKILQEVKPDSREAYGSLIQYSKAFSKDFTSVSSYRFYSDSWDIYSHTINTETYYSVSDFTFGLGLRGYTQSKAKFYSKEKDKFTDEKYASSDRRMSKFSSYNYKLSLDYKLNEDIVLNSSYNYYIQDDYFDATYYNVGMKYKF
jgi:hypothetical protein